MFGADVQGFGENGVDVVVSRIDAQGVDPMFERLCHVVMEKVERAETDCEQRDSFGQFEEGDEEEGGRFLSFQLEHIMAYEAFGICRFAVAWGESPRMAGCAHAGDGHGDLRGDCAAVWNEAVPFAVERPVLVSGPRGGDGNGLALFRDHDLGVRGVETRAESTGA